MVADSARKKLSSVPFPAIVGQDDLKQVLLLAAAHDELSGAVITGEKGTAKSTAVRALVDLLPEQRVVADCPYHCDPAAPADQCDSCRERSFTEAAIETRRVPLVTLPLGATRDRVVGTLSIADAMEGESEFDPGLLAAANRGILYVDEINLLDDHLVDVLLDAAASGINTVERDGISVSHPAQFTLIGTMNPEEGDLRPQLRDRFDLQATVTGCEERADRVRIIDQALTEGDDQEYAEEVAAYRRQLQTACDEIGSVTLPASLKASIAELCTDAGVDGHRADIATARAAIASAALDGRPKVIESDIEQVARFTLPHRLRTEPFEEPPDLEELLEDQFDDAGEDETEDGTDGEQSDGEPDDETGEKSEDSEEESEGSEGQSEDTETPSEDEQAGEERGENSADSRGTETEGGDNSSGEGGVDSENSDDDTETNPTGVDTTPQNIGESSERENGDQSGEEQDEATPILPGEKRGGVGDATAPEIEKTASEQDTGSQPDSSGSHQTTHHASGRGSRVRTEPASGEEPIDAAASVRTAAARGHEQVEADDLQQSVRTQQTTATVVFAVDASASMRPAMERAKGVVLALLRDAYEQRDEVGFVAFGGDDAEVLLPPTSSVSLAARHLKELPTGDRTPLPAGIETARKVLSTANPAVGVVVLVTDGRGNVANGSPTAATREAARGLAADGWEVVIVDASNDREGLVSEIAAETDGRVIPLSSLTPELVSSAVGEAVESSATENR